RHTRFSRDCSSDVCSSDLDGLERMLTAIRNRMQVPSSLRELIILRIAVLNEAPFEFDAHVPHARRAGVPDDAIEALRQPVLPPRSEERRLGDESRFTTTTS